MASQLSDLLPSVLQHVAQCSDVQAEIAIRETVVDFFKRSKVLWADLAPISVVADQAAYALPNPAGYQILHIRNATINGYPLKATSEELLDLQWEELQQGFEWRYNSSYQSSGMQEDWRLAVSECPGLVYCPTPNQAVLVGIPTAAIANGLKVRVVTFPLPSVTEIEDWIYAMHWEALRDGAVARLKGMKDKPFSDRNGAAVFAVAYDNFVLDAESAGLRSHKRNDQQHRRTKVWR